MTALQVSKTAPLLAALAYDQLPGRFHPLREGKKTPILSSWQVAASADTAQVQAWAKHYPRSNLGFVPNPEYFVLDIDCKGAVNGFDALARLEAATGEPLPETLTATTPSGGRHLFFHGGGMPFKTCTSAGGYKGLDIRAGGGSAGYVALTPSEIDSGVYSWLNWPMNGDVPHLAEAPKWLISLACDVDPLKRPEVKPERTDAAGGNGAQLLEHLREALKFLDFYAYDVWISCGEALKTLDDAGLDLWLEWSSACLRYDEAEAIEKWETFKPTKTGYPAVFCQGSGRRLAQPGRFPT